MKSLLHIEHIHQQEKQASKFIKDILRKEYDIYEFSYDPYNIDDNNYTTLAGKIFDVVVCWQILPSRDILNAHISFKKGIFFPMYDGSPDINSPLWREYNDFLMINFSKTMYLQCLSLGLRSQYIQYFPEPADIHDWGNQNSVFFWNHIEDINVNSIGKLLSDSDISHLHLHKALDPEEKLKKLNRKWNINITESTWYDKKEDMLADIDKSALYIAPRIAEGIGMSFLEAMARGRCVIANNAPTMNEYIEDGVNGFLYDINKLKRLNINDIRTIQGNAYNFIKSGYNTWTNNKYKINTWINEFYDGKKNILIDEEFLINEISNNENNLDYIINTNKFHVYVICQPENVFNIYDIIQKNNINVSIVTNSSQLEFIDAYLYSNFNNENFVINKKWILKYNIDGPIDIKYIIQDIEECQILYPKVTIITVVYNAIDNNRQESLIKCFESVHSQIYDGEIEHLVIDGKSTDGTCELLESYAKKGWIQFFSEPDIGIYDAMNKGLAKADGEFIAYINSDDRYCNIFAIKCCIKSLMMEKADYCFGDIFAISSDNTWIPVPDKATSIPLATHHCHQSMFVKTSVMRDMGGFNLEYKISADRDLTIRLYALQKKYTYIDLYYVRYQLGGWSEKNSEQSLMERVISFYKWIGKNYNLTFNECLQIENGKYINWPLETFISVFRRLSDDYLSHHLGLCYFSTFNKYINSELIKYFFYKKMLYKFLSCLPIKSIKEYYKGKYKKLKDILRSAEIAKIYFLGLKIITKITFNNVTFYNILTNIPLFSITRGNNLVICILGIKIFRLKTKNHL